MNLIKFLISKQFLKQIALALVATAVICFIVLKWLNVTTNHGEFIEVPNLKGKSLSLAEMELRDNTLVMEIQDSASFNPKYPKFSVIDQDPVAGDKVKENRKIYITLNPSGYKKIKVPNLKERTFRQVKPTLEALGFRVGKTIYKDNLGKDIVLEMQFKGKPLNTGDKLPKTSVIDLVLGNGKRP